MTQLLPIDTGLTPDLSQVAIEDETPVDNLLSEKQQRLLIEPLYSNAGLWENRTFLAAANVGVFYSVRLPPIVPDMFLSLDVEVPQDWSEKKNRTYFMWEFGKPPDVAIEIVSNREGNELGRKLETYATFRVSYYIVFDPLRQLGDELLRLFELRAGVYQPLASRYLESVGLGLMLWPGEFEGKQDTWLRWCNLAGDVLPTGAELAESERQRAESERQRAESERQRADEAEAKAARLADRLRAMGLDPEAIGD